jgi:hypothetical protein
MTFKCEWIQKWAEDETLEAVGLRWTEGRPFRESVCFIFGGSAFVLGLGHALMRGQADFIPIALGGAVLLAIAIFGPGRVREIVFWRDGRMETPLGLSTGFLWPGERWLHHTGIRSIETETISREGMYTHGVRIFYEGGETNHVAKNLTPDAAHMVAVRLTTALKHLREHLAQSARTGQSRRTTGSVERVID